MAAAEADERVELQVFFCKEAYVYQIPPATTVGHRADTWNVNKWLCEVAVRVVTADEDCFVRLEDCKSGELFAECPVPSDAPLVTVVEPVIDSSRYFVLRIVDRDTGRHAFIGMGFRERSEASNFNAVLHEHLQYLKRKRIAEVQRREYEEREQRASEGAEVGEGEAQALPAVDYSIKPGEMITIKLNVAKQDGKPEGSGFLSKGSKLSARFNLFAGSGEGGPTLSPPPAARRAAPGAAGESGSPVVAAAAAMCISPRGSAETPSGFAAASPSSGSGGEGSAGPIREASGALGEAAAAATAAAAASKLGQLALGGPEAQGAAGASGGATDAAATTEEDDWGDFTG